MPKMSAGPIVRAAIEAKRQKSTKPECYLLRRRSGTWVVDRKHPYLADQYHTVVMATEGEARVCHEALNAYAVKARKTINATMRRAAAGKARTK
jgi:hypothetical protein